MNIFELGWLPLSFLIEKKLVALGLEEHQLPESWGLRETPWSLPSWLLGWPLGSQNKSLLVGLPLDRPPSLLVARGVCHKSSLSLTLPFNQGESSQERKWPESGDVLKGRHPSPIWFLCVPSVIGIAPGSVCPKLSHYYNVHPRLSTHHPRLYHYQSSTLTHQGSLTKIKLHRIRQCDLYTLYASTSLDPISNSGKLPHLWHLCLWRWGGLSSCEFCLLFAVSLIRNAGICLTCQTWMTRVKSSIVSSCCSQTHDLGKVMGSEVTEACGLSDIYCSLGLLRADVVMVDGQSHPPQAYLLWGNLSNSQIGRAVGPAGSHVDTPAPHPYSMACYGLHNGSSTFLDCHSISSKVGQFSNPHTCSSE